MENLDVFAVLSYKLDDCFSVSSIDEKFIWGERRGNLFGYFQKNTTSDGLFYEEPSFEEEAMLLNFTLGIARPYDLNFTENFKRSIKAHKQHLNGINYFMNANLDKVFQSGCVNRVTMLMPFYRVSFLNGSVLSTFLFIVEMLDQSKWLIVSEVIPHPLMSDFVGEQKFLFPENQTEESYDNYVNRYVHNFDTGARAGTFSANGAYQYETIDKDKVKGKLVYVMYKLSIVIKHSLNIDISKAVDKRWITSSKNGFIDKNISEKNDMSIFYNFSDCAINVITDAINSDLNREFLVNAFTGFLLIDSTNKFLEILEKHTLSEADKDRLDIYYNILKRFERRYSLIYHNQLDVYLKKTTRKKRNNIADNVLKYSLAALEFFKIWG